MYYFHPYPSNNISITPKQFRQKDSIYYIMQWYCLIESTHGHSIILSTASVAYEVTECFISRLSKLYISKTCLKLHAPMQWSVILLYNLQFSHGVTTIKTQQYIKPSGGHYYYKNPVSLIKYHPDITNQILSNHNRSNHQSNLFKFYLLNINPNNRSIALSWGCLEWLISCVW